MGDIVSAKCTERVRFVVIACGFMLILVLFGGMMGCDERWTLWVLRQRLKGQLVCLGLGIWLLFSAYDDVNDRKVFEELSWRSMEYRP